MKLALATCSKQPNLHESDIPLIALFKEYNIEAEAAIWNDPDIDWRNYDAVLIRSVWDYHLYETDFTQWLESLVENGIYVLNPVNSILKNNHKFYLQQLEQSGINIIPTAMIYNFTPNKFGSVNNYLYICSTITAYATRFQKHFRLTQSVPNRARLYRPFNTITLERQCS